MALFTNCIVALAIRFEKVQRDAEPTNLSLDLRNFLWFSRSLSGELQAYEFK